MIKDAVALEIYSIMHKFMDSLERHGGDYLVVEFKNGRIVQIEICEKNKEKSDVISIHIPERGNNFGKRLYRRIRDAVENANVEIDRDYWNLIANAYDWVWM